MKLERALQTEGWMSQPELEWLAEQARHGDVVEVGSWMGRTTRAMADNKKDGRIFAVDTWEGSQENQEFLKDKPHGYLFKQFCDNLREHIKSGLVIPFRMSSLRAADYFAQATKLDMVFLDASHEYQDIHADILAWRPLLKHGGLLSGHDFDLGWPGVVRAVRELIAPHPEQAAGGSSIWFTRV